MAQNIVQTPQPPPRMPFRFAARQHVTPAGNVPYKAGSKAQGLDLPPIGWSGRLFISLRGQMVAGGSAPAFKNNVEQAWNLIQRIQIGGNGGLANIVDLSGFDAYLYSHFIERGYKLDAPGVGSSAVDPLLIKGTSPGAGATVNDFCMTYVIPLAANNGLGFETGLLGFQAKDAQFKLDLTFAALSDIYNNAPTINNASVDVFYLWYEQPDTNRVDMPFPQIVRLSSMEKALINTTSELGNAVDIVDVGGTLMQAIIAVKVNDAYSSANLERILLKLNKNITAYEMAHWVARLQNRYQLGVDLPEGVTAMDFYHSTQSVSEGDPRDMWDLDQYSSFDIALQLKSAVVTDAATSRARVIIRSRHDLV